ncbi:DNA-binding protein [Micromonospora zhanjiangensis]|uniref:DNA-binding protein n=1 Tax=Micromonospora zhanjiangensis TaxID=1522057 RepID=A0ABV8KL26_9ACTN
MELELWAAQEIGQYLNVSRQRVSQLAARHHDWPQPVATLAVGRIWLADDIRAWAAKRGRPLPIDEPDEGE